MSEEIILSNLLNPPVLFFFLGLVAVIAGSDLDVPQPLPKLLSLYLLIAIGFHGGAELRHSGLSLTVLEVLGAAVLMAFLVPFYAYALLRTRLNSANAAAVAASYGSVSAVTFIAASSFLGQLNIPYSGYMVAALALMESPAILVAVALHRMAQTGAKVETSVQTESVATDLNDSSAQPMRSKKMRRGNPSEIASAPALHQTGLSHILRESFLNGSVVLLIGSVIIGALCGEAGEKMLNPFIKDIFRGMLCLFLLDMGLVSGRRLGSLRETGLFAVVFALALPLLNATLGIGVAYLLQLNQGDAFLFCVLCASASYIAVPAAMRLAIPEASPGLYVTPALAITFPFNIVIGFPIYHSVIQALWR